MMSGVFLAASGTPARSCCGGATTRVSPPARSLLIAFGRSATDEFSVALAPLGIEVQSAGFIGFNRPAPDEAIAAARVHGVDLANHRSRIPTVDMVRTADLIVVMEPAQRRLVCERFGRRPRDVIVLGDFDPVRVETRMIRDPVNESRAVFDQVYERIARCVRELAKTLSA